MWHPLVHDLFGGKRLTFFVVRVASTGLTSAMDYMANYLPSIGLSSWNVYAVYGEDDLVVRCWTTPGRQRQVRLHLRDERRWHVDQFECDKVEYLWQSDAPAVAREDVAEFANIIRDLNARGSTELVDSPDVRTLTDRGIVLPVPARDRKAIKVYMHLRPESGLPGDVDVAARLRRLLTSSEQLDEPTLHTSIDGHFLIKAVLAEYSGLLRVLQDVERELGSARYSSKTLLVAASTRDENDAIDEGEESLSTELALLGSTCGSEVQALLPTARDGTRTDLQVLYREFVDVFASVRGAPGTLGVNALSGLVVYRISGNGERFAQLTTPLFASLEGNLQETLQAVLMSAAGSGWYRELDVGAGLLAAGARGRNGVSPKIRDCNLTQLGQLYAQFARANDEVQRAVDDALGSRWAEILTRVSNMRNDLIHGHVGENRLTDTFLAQPFMEWAPLLIGAVEIHTRATRFRASFQGVS